MAATKKGVLRSRISLLGRLAPVGARRLLTTQRSPLRSSRADFCFALIRISILRVKIEDLSRKASIGRSHRESRIRPELMYCLPCDCWIITLCERKQGRYLSGVSIFHIARERNDARAVLGAEGVSLDFIHCD